jgi:response regulator RpfG family c-di-GMP phosphodiesterase
MTANVTTRPRVLCVDDEPNVLASLSRALRLHYDVVTAEGAAAGLALLASEPPFAVVVSDLRMPGTDGVKFLARVRQLAPHTVRVLLTGHAEVHGAITAVNDGQVFRFLVKPCDMATLLAALGAAVEQHRLVTAERVLLEQTVHGCIKALTDLLAIVQPASFGRATRLKRHVEALAIDLGVPDRWQVEIAALLSQVGYIVVPPEVAERVHRGHRLTHAERDLVARLPGLAEQLVASIPRMDGVRAILLHQNAPFGPAASAAATPGAESVPIGSRLLRLAADFDELEAQGMSAALALDALERRSGLYDPVVLAALRRVCGVEQRTAVVQEMRLADVRPGMIFATDVIGTNGLLLVARGQEVTPSLVERIRNSWSGFATSTTVSVVSGAAQPPRAGAQNAGGASSVTPVPSPAAPYDARREAHSALRRTA